MIFKLFVLIISFITSGFSRPEYLFKNAFVQIDGVPAAENPDEVIKASRRVHEKLDEVDLSKTTVVNLFGSTALTLAGQLEQTPRVLKDIKDVLKSQGKSPEEIDKVQKDVKELFKDNEFMEIYTDFDEKIQQIAQKKKQITEQKETIHDEAASSVLTQNDLTPPDSSMISASSESAFPKAPDITQPEGPNLTQAVALSTLETQDANLTRDCLLKLNVWQQKVAKWAESHPEKAQKVRVVLDTVIQAGSIYAFAQAGILGAEIGAILGPCGSAFGAVGMVTLAYGSSQVFAEGLDAGLNLAAQKAATLGRTPSEAQELAQTVKKTGEVGATILALAGMKKGIKVLKKPTAAPIKDALSEKPVIKDGYVFLGEQNLGPIVDMPTVRTFTKPMGPTLRKKFESTIYDKEVMFHGPGTGYDYRVYQRNDIDWGLVRTKGRPEHIGKTNLEAARLGIAPELIDGSVVNLHHVGQNGLGPLVEVTTQIHSKSNVTAFRAIHNQFKGKGHPSNPVNHSVFDADRIAYWKGRAENVSKK